MPTLEVNGGGKKVGVFDWMLIVQLVQFIWGLFKAKVAEGDPQAVAFALAAEKTEVGKLVLAAKGQKVEAIDFGGILKWITKLSKIAALIGPQIPQIIAILTSDE